MWEMSFTVVCVYTTLKAGFNMIATITVKAAITENKFSDCGKFSDCEVTRFSSRFLEGETSSLHWEKSRFSVRFGILLM